MAYNRKPSTACEACRKIKTKCNGDPNGCKQCKNAGRVCPGYRSALDLAFRDETPKLIQKATASRTRMPSKALGSWAKSKECAKSTQPLVSQSIRPKSASDKDETGSPKLLERIVFSLDDRAKSYFVSNFADGIIFDLDGENELTSLAFMLNSDDHMLTASFKAISMVFYASFARSAALELASKRLYVQAIRFANKAIASPTEAIKDETLLSVHFLGLYEVLSGHTKRSMKYWADHCQGAAALVKLRGEHQFQTSAGCRLFNQVRASLIKICLQWTIRLPDHIIELSSVYAERAGLTTWKRCLFDACASFNQFRYDVRSGVIENPQEIVTGALQLDGILEEWFDVHAGTEFSHSLPNSNTNSNHVSDDCRHSEVESVSAWNAARSLRILIHQEIRKAINTALSCSFTMSNPLPLAWIDQAPKSVEVCYKMQAGILASAPASLDVADAHLEREPRSVFNMVWPLWIAGSMHVATLETRAYCARVLSAIGHRLGHKHASVLGNLLYNPPEPVVWRRD